MKRKLTLNIACCSWFNAAVPWAGCAGCCKGRIIVDISGAAAERAAERGSEEAASSSLERLSERVVVVEVTSGMSLGWS